MKEGMNVSENKRKIQPNEMREFIIGVLLLAVGLFILSLRVRVYTGWYGFSIGHLQVSSGIITIPFIIGIDGYFINPKSIIPKIIIALGSIFIIVSIILNTTFRFEQTTLFEYLLIFILIAAGLGLVLKTMFTDKKQDK